MRNKTKVTWWTQNERGLIVICEDTPRINSNSTLEIPITCFDVDHLYAYENNNHFGSECYKSTMPYYIYTEINLSGRMLFGDGHNKKFSSVLFANVYGEWIPYHKFWIDKKITWIPEYLKQRSIDFFYLTD